MSTSFIVNAGDLAKILDQIRVAETEVATGLSLAQIIGQDASLLPIGLRKVDGSDNHLLPGETNAGAADQIFPRLLTPVYINEADGDTMPLGPPGSGAPTISNTNYDPTKTGTHSVADADPRIISNLIVDQTLNNRSALVAALVVAGAPDAEVAADAIMAARSAAATAALNTSTHAAYVAAQASAGDVNTDLAAVQSSLTAFRDGMDDDVLGPEDIQAVAAAAAAAHDAKLAQDAVVTALHLDANVATADIVKAEALQTALNALDAALNSYASATTGSLADGISLAEFNAIVRAQTAAIAAATTATANAAAINAAETGTSSGGAALALANLLDANGLEISSDGSVLIEHRSADIGLSPPNSAWMAFFGQFFDHGLDLVTKGSNGTIYIPLQEDDPLIAGPDHILHTNDDLPPEFRFMTLSRVTPFDANGNPSPTGTESQNTTTPFVDQNQTYTSSASHQVFLREYKFSVDSDGDTVADSFAVNTGHLLNGEKGSIATWADVKAQALDKLGLILNDVDVLDVPTLVVDDYGKFTPGAHGYAQVYVKVQVVNASGTVVATIPGNFIMEGSEAGLNLHQLPLPTGFTFAELPPGQTYVTSVIGTGHAFLNDIAHNAVPGTMYDPGGDHPTGTLLVVQPDDDDVPGTDIPADYQGRPMAYDDELLNSHFMTGDGRGNENIGLTAVHTIFHSEHNRLVEVNKDTLIATGDFTVVREWLAPDSSGARNGITQAGLDAINALTGDAKAAAIDALNWDGERLFQAARFVTEMQYQHLVFEEFARRIQPNVDPFVFTNSAELNPAIVAEFAHTVYRFGHSMLTDTVDRLDNDLSLVNSDNPLANDQDQVTLIDAFLNPQEFTSSGIDAETATGALIRGMSRQVGNEIDEFVVEALRNNLLGLPLDLPALNIARGRDTGIPSLNDSRAQIYAMTGAADVKPYTSWTDFAQHIKHPLSVINFIAAYGTHPLVLAETTSEGKRAAAMAIVLGTDQNVPANAEMHPPVLAHTIHAPADRLDFLNATGAYAGGSLGGLNAVDLWIGGLAEELNEFGGQLGSTFNFVFEYQLEHLQNGDRFYYLSRTQGMNLLNLLEPNTFTDLVMRNTDLGKLHSTHLPANLMSAQDMILELDTLAGQENYSGITARDHTNPTDRSLLDPFWESAFQQSIDPKVLRIQGTARMNGLVPVLDAEGKQIYDGGVLKFSGGEHVVLGGTEGNDRLIGDKGIDALWGDGGNDYLNAGMESDQVYGGDGDDIIEDPFGDDFLRGEAGDDVIVADQGIDLLFGGEGQDFLMGVTDTKEVFSGPGNDFVLGGSAPDTLGGNEGDDWIEGGEGFDDVFGENSDLFFNSPIIGHDILNGQGNDTDYDGESGDDIMVQGPGIQRNNGMLGFDWVIQKGDPNDGLIDLGISRFLTQQALTLRDRNDSVEGASGWKHNDTLIGTSAPVGAVGDPAGGIVGAPPTDSFLLSQNVKLIQGLEEFLKLTPGAVRGQTVGTDAQTFASLDADTTVFDPSLGGDILLGGAGSDLIFGKAGNDLMDGDRWLNVRIAVHATKDLSGPVLFSVDSLTSKVAGSGDPNLDGKFLSDLLRTGKINPGQMQAVREIITDGALASDVDVAMFAGSREDFTITRNANGSVTIVDNVVAPVLAADGTPIPLLNDEGTDTLTNFEYARFTNYDAAGLPTGTFRDVFLGRATGAPTITSNGTNRLTANIAGIIDVNGINTGTLSYQWQTSTTGNNGPASVWNNVPGVANQPQNVNAQAGLFYRVIVSYVDNDGLAESVTSVMTAKVGTAGNDTLTGTADPNLLVGLAGDDTIDGSGGNDIIDGGAGADAMTGGAGDDTFVVDDVVGAARDTIIEVAGGGIDTVTGAVNLDLANFANVENITLTGTGNFSATGNGDANVIIGNTGNNVIDGGAGADTMRGGNGNDTYVVDNAGDVVDEATSTGTDTVQSSVTYTLGANLENLTLTGTGAINGTGNALNNVITGNGAINTLSGGDGNDTLDGGAGADILIGGAGNDTYVVDAAADSVQEALNGGSDTVQAAVSYTLGANVENLTLTGGGNIYGTGNELNNVITGNGGDNTLTGGDGNDTLAGGGGTDTLVGGNGNDSLDGGAGVDNLSGGDGNDILDGGAGADTMAGGAGDDIYIVNAAGDTVNETAAGSSGTDTVRSSVTHALGTNVENLTLTGAADINGTGNGIANVIIGNTGANNLAGGAGADWLNGGADNDILDGGTENDVIIGGAGNDTIALASGGNDILVYNATGQGTDTVSTFDADPAGGQDLIDISGLGITAGTFNARVTISTVGGVAQAVVTDTNGQAVATIRFPGVVAGNINATDFILASGSVINGSNVPNNNNTLNGTALNDFINGNNGTDTINYAVGGGRDVVNGGAGTDTFVVTGNAQDETYRLFTRSAALQQIAGLTLAAGTEIVITRNVGAAAATAASVIAELANIEEITINGGAGTNLYQVIGDFTATSLALNTVHIDGSSGDDTVDISSLQSDHRIVFTSNGGNDKIVGTLRPQDVVQFAAGTDLSGFELTSNDDGTKTFSDGSHGVTFTGSAPQFHVSGSSGDDEDDEDTGSGDGDDDSSDSGDDDGDDDNSGSGDDEGDDDNSGSGDDDGDDDNSGSGDDDGDDDSGSGDDDDEDDSDDDEDDHSGSDDGDDDDDDSGNGDDDEDDSDDDTNQPPAPGQSSGGSAMPFVIYLGVAGGGTGVGGAYGDVLSGMDCSDSLFGLGGDDSLVGNGGADNLVGGDGHDLVFGGDGNDRILAGTGDDMLFGDNGDDTIWADAGNDRITGGAGHDVIDGGDGNDTIYAELNDGDDVISGGADYDTIDYQAITAALTINLGGNGSGSAHSAQTGTDVLNDIENVKGGSGNDTIYASIAHNVMDGGAGSDTFVFNSAAIADGDRIEGFTHGDTIDLTPFLPDGVHVVTNDATFNLAGEVRLIFINDTDTKVEGNTDHDADTDFSFIVAGKHLTSTDFS